MAKSKKMKLKFNAIVAPLRKLLDKLEAYILECVEAQKANEAAIQELVTENQIIGADATKSATTVKQLKVMLGDEVEVAVDTEA
jgi:hypothetical protein